MSSREEEEKKEHTKRTENLSVYMNLRAQFVTNIK